MWEWVKDTSVKQNHIGSFSRDAEAGLVPHVYSIKVGISGALLIYIQRTLAC